MLISIESTYLAVSIFSFIILLLFSLNKSKIWRDILLAGIIIGIFSVLTAYLFWTYDWWFPITITQTRIGIEDFILGFDAGMLGVLLSQSLFVRFPISKKVSWGVVWSASFLFMGVLAIGFYVFSLTSFFSFVLAAFTTIIVNQLQSNTLFYKHCIYAFIYVLFTIPIYFLIKIINSNWVTQTWSSQLLSGIRLFGFLPVEELIFWFFFGVIFNQIYLKWRNSND